MKLVLAEKPSVAQSIAKVLGAAKREDGYLEGNGYVVSWCVGHLVELAQPEVYDAKYSKWAFRFFQSVVVQFIIEAVFKVMVGGNQIAGSHALLVAVNHLRCQPFWFVGNHFIQLTHLGNLCMAVACPQMLFAVLSCTKEVFAVHRLLR